MHKISGCVTACFFTHTHTSTVSVNIAPYFSLSLQTLFFSKNLTLVSLHVNITKERNLNWKQNHYYAITIINQDYFPFWKHRRTFIPHSGRRFKINRKFYFKNWFYSSNLQTNCVFPLWDLHIYLYLGLLSSLLV